MTDSKPTISVIIPARNEEQHLPGCLAAISDAEKAANIVVEKVVVINRCTDRTEAIARAHGCRIIALEEKNLAAIRNSGVQISTGEWIITIDADSRMSPKTFVEVSAKLSDPGVVGGGIWIFPERYSLGILLTGIILLPYIIFERLSGGLFWFRRKDFEKLGGFDERFVSVEDIDFARRLKRLGKSTSRRFCTIRRAWIVTSCRKFDRFGDWYFLRNPRELLSIFRGRDQRIADKIWYDFNS